MMRNKKISVAILLSVVAKFAIPVANAEVSKPKLNHDIKRTEIELERKEKQRAALEAEFENIDRKIARHSKRLLDLDDDIKQLRVESNKLNSQIQTTQTQYMAMRVRLDQYARAAYKLGRQPFVKMVLNQEDAASTGRTLVYFDYFRKAYSAEIESVSGVYIDQKNLERRNTEQLARLENVLNNIKTERKGLESVKTRRSELVANLNASIDRVSRKLNGLYEDRKHLETLARDLAKASKSRPSASGDAIMLTGEWPVAGKLLTRYGEPRVASGEIKWDGVLIGSNEGDPVHSIANGRVVFSDWMRAYGYLTIIDHENGYMSLYGHNQMLVKNLGDSVKRGDIVGYVGLSGGQPQPALYFEIRRRGEPIDPTKWMSAHR